ncbi:MAG: type II toxin-antitoxin system RelE/ParE family toxin [Planctomycetota bacterium]
MALEVKFQQRAVEDLERIWQHIAQDSENYASAVATSIVTAAEELSEYPRIGHRVEHVVRAEVRELSVCPYRLFYAIRQDAIWILAVAHGARDLRKPFFDRLT